MRALIMMILLLLAPLAARAEHPYDGRYGNEDRHEVGRAAEAIQKALDSDFQIGREIAADFAPGGSQFDGREYAEHPLDDGDPLALVNYGAIDIANVSAGLPSCLGFRWTFWTEGLAVCSGPEFFWPEVVVTVNDYGRSSYFQEPAAEAQTSAWRLLLTTMRAMLIGLDPKDGIPITADDNKHHGRSATEPGGDSIHDGIRTYEAHAFTSGFVFFFNEILEELKESNPIIGVIVRLFRHCFPNRRKFVFNMSEMMPQNWRIAELSSLRVSRGEQKYREVYGPVFDLQRSVSRRMFDRYSHNPLVPQGAAGPYEHLPWQALREPVRRNMCASYRAADGEAIGDALNATLMPWEELVPAERGSGVWPIFERQCYHETFGELYPLTGAVQSNSPAIAPLLAARKFMEWASWRQWPWQIRANYFNDDHGQKQLFRRGGEDDGVKYDDRRPDRIQRLFPERTGCFTTKDVHDRNLSDFPRDLVKREDEGEMRFVFWNRRRCGYCARLFFWEDPRSWEE